MSILQRSAIILLGASGLFGSSASVVLGHRECCGKTFEFRTVAGFAKEILHGLAGEIYSVLITPSSSRMSLGVATSSEESVAFCRDMAVRLRTSESHAYLLKTAMGAALHHWDSKRRVYQSEVLAGVDVYQRKFEAGRVAWIGDYLGRMPKLWLASDRELSAEDALAFSKEVLREVGINKAATYVRTDPYFWPPDSCSPYSLPLQWRQMVPPDVHEISRHTIVCKIDLLGKSDDCVMYRSK